jgi:hypothetical protein
MDYGKTMDTVPLIMQSIIGCKNIAGCIFILKYLHDRGLLAGRFHQPASESLLAVLGLSVSGWQYYDQLMRGTVNSTKAFMAMKYGEPILDDIFKKYFKVAVAATGFKLIRLTIIQKLD